MIPAEEFKSEGTRHHANLVGFYDFLGVGGYGILQKYLAIQYYLTAAPVADGIDRISDSFSNIKPRVKNTKTGHFEKDHPVLTLLAKPNADQTYSEFAKSIASFMLITGEAYPLITGNTRRPPLEIFSETPINVSLFANSHDGLLQTISVQRANTKEEFNRHDVHRQFRYINSSSDREAWQIRSFNAKQNVNDLRGVSKLQPVMAEIEQYISGSTHNLSLLKRGARPSGLFSAKEPITDDSYTRLQEQIDNWYSGAQNAGRPLIGDGGIEYKDIIINNRDMDYMNLKNNVTMAVYNQLKIPLPLINQKSMTFNNLQTAKLSLYDDAVIPLASRLFEELTRFLMPRYEKSSDLIITFDPSSISALQIRQVETVKARAHVGVNTINELRTFLGDESLGPDGDVVLMPATMIPIADDDFTEDQRRRPASKFVDIMKRQVNEDGSRKYTDEEISDYVKSFKLFDG